jgi:hypothetical protein
MSISELLPAVQALPELEKRELIRILTEDLAVTRESPLTVQGAEFPIWTPLAAYAAGETMMAAIEERGKRPHG